MSGCKRRATQNMSYVERIESSGTGLAQGACESCGLWITAFGGYKIARLRGLYCSARCAEQGIFYSAEPNRRGSRGAGIETGRLLRDWIAKLAAVPADGSCLNCGASLAIYRAGARYCSASCRSAASRTVLAAKNTLQKLNKNAGLSVNVPICLVVDPQPRDAALLAA